MKRLAFSPRSPAFWPVIAIVALFALNGVVNPSFFDFTIRNGQVFGSVVDVFFRAAPLILTALGMTLVIATGGVDLSVGSVAALAASTAAFSFASGASMPVALLSGLSAGAIVGAWNAFLITKLQLQPIIATLISMVAGRGLAQLLVGGQIVPLNDSAYVWIGTGALFGLPFAIWLALAVTLGAHFALRRTSAGLFIEAVGSNSLASRHIGLSVSKVHWLVYSIVAVLAAVAGTLMSANIRAVDGNNLGLYLELDAILAVVIGGTRLTGGRFSILGTLLGALIIQTVATTINTQGVAIELMLMVKAAIVIAICLAQSGRLSIPLLKPAPEVSR